MWRTIVFSILLAVLSRHVFIVIMTMGFHKFVYNHKPGACDFVNGIESGSEDIEVMSDGTVLVSSGYVPIPSRVEGALRGHIYWLEWDHPDRGATEVEIRGDIDVAQFHPHGFSLYEDKATGKAYLLVVSHHVGFGTIEIFEYERKSKTLVYIRTVQDKLFTSVNDVLALGPDEFYLTNDGYSLGANTRYVEQMLRLHWGGVVYCNRAGCRQVSEPLFEANGITMSRDGRYVYVALCFDGLLNVYERRSSDNSFVGSKAIQTINIGTGVDNIFVDDAGDLWIGCHPVLYRVERFFGEWPLDGPAQVLRVRLHGSTVAPYERIDIDEAFSHNGGNITQTSVAVYRRDRLLIGTVLGRMMYCSVDAL